VFGNFLIFIYLTAQGLGGSVGVFQVLRGVCKECLQRYEDLAVWLWSPAFSGLLRNEAGGGSGPLRLSHMEPCGCIMPKQKKKSSTVASGVCFLQMLSAVLHCICAFYSLLSHYFPQNEFESQPFPSHTHSWILIQGRHTKREPLVSKNCYYSQNFF